MYKCKKCGSEITKWVQDLSAHKIDREGYSKKCTEVKDDKYWFSCEKCGWETEKFETYNAYRARILEIANWEDN